MDNVVQGDIDLLEAFRDVLCDSVQIQVRDSGQLEHISAEERVRALLLDEVILVEHGVVGTIGQDLAYMLLFNRDRALKSVIKLHDSPTLPDDCDDALHVILVV